MVSKMRVKCQRQEDDIVSGNTEEKKMSRCVTEENEKIEGASKNYN